MVSAFSAASSTATPRSFKLIIGMMFREMLCFIGSFIYSIVAKSLKNGYYGIAGFTLFIFTLLFFALVILTFTMGRAHFLGRMEHTIKCRTSH
jgi:uncharacterized membrane protein